MALITSGCDAMRPPRHQNGPDYLGLSGQVWATVQEMCEQVRGAQHSDCSTAPHSRSRSQLATRNSNTLSHSHSLLHTPLALALTLLLELVLAITLEFEHAHALAHALALTLALELDYSRLHSTLHLGGATSSAGRATGVSLTQPARVHAPGGHAASAAIPIATS